MLLGNLSRLACLGPALGLLLVTIPGCIKLSPRHKNGANVLSVIEPTKTEADGTVTATLSASIGATQKITASTAGALKGSDIAFPPGTLAVDTDVSFAEGQSLVTSAGPAVGAAPGDLTEGSPTALVTPSTPIDPKGPFTIAITLDQNPQLALAGTSAKDVLVVLYLTINYADGGKITAGFIPRDQLKLWDNLVVFSAKSFGAYQVVYAKPVIDVAKQAQVDQPLLSKTQAAAPESLVLAYSDSTPPSPANATHFLVKGTAPADADTVGLFSDATCTQTLVSGTKAIYESTGLDVPIQTNATLDVYGKATLHSVPLVSCTKLVTLVSEAGPPAAPVVTSAKSVWNNALPTWTWSTPEGVTGYRYKLDSNDLTAGATETTDISFTPTDALVDGQHTLYVQTRNKSGNWSTSGSFEVTIDTVAPAITITTPASGTDVDTQSFTVKGTCETGLPVHVTSATGLDAVADQTCAGDTFSFTMHHQNAVAALVDMSFSVSQADVAGNSGTLSRSYKYGITDYAHLTLWLDAADPTSAASSAGNLTVWHDKTTHGHNATPQGSVPLVTVSGHTMASFDGSATYCAIPSDTGIDFDLSTTAITVFIVYQANSGTIGTLLGKSVNTGTEYLMGLSSSDTIEVVAGGAAYYSAANQATSSVTVLSAEFKTSGVDLFQNGTNVISNAIAPGTSTTTNDLLIGAQRDISNTTATSYVAAKIGEVLLYDTELATTDRQAIESHLKQKWGIP